MTGGKGSSKVYYIKNLDVHQWGKVVNNLNNNNMDIENKMKALCGWFLKKYIDHHNLTQIRPSNIHTNIQLSLLIAEDWFNTYLCISLWHVLSYRHVLHNLRWTHWWHSNKEEVILYWFLSLLLIQSGPVKSKSISLSSVQLSGQEEYRSQSVEIKPSAPTQSASML